MRTRFERATSLRASRTNRGTILIIALWVAFGLVSLALYFGQTVRWNYQAGQNSLADRQARQAVDGARRYIAFVLDNLVEAGEMPDLDAGDYVAEDASVGDSRFWLIGRDPDTDIAPDNPVWGLVDEASKLNVNTATQEMLESVPGMTTALAAAIIDWRDADSELTSEGAESPEYETLDTPYSAKNGPFESLEELRLVQGMDLSVLWGEDANGNGVLDENENDGDKSWPDDDADGRLDPGLAEYLTVWTRESNTRSDGSSKVDIRGSSARQELRQLFGEAFGDARADAILERIGIRLGDIRSPLEFYMDSGMTAEEFAQVEDGLTVGSGEYREGLVNLRTASSTVLACLPGMDTAKAETLAAERRKRDATTLDSTAWVVGVLDAATIREIGPWVTAKTYQMSADIVAVGANGRGLQRSWMVFDREDQSRVIYRRDRIRMGWPLGAVLRDELRGSIPTTLQAGRS